MFPQFRPEPSDRSTAVSSGELVRDIHRACMQARRDLGGHPLAAAIADIEDRLDEPVPRIAVGGRLNAGKSTLVNALLGQKLAATGATECTTVVAWFRYHHQNRVVVRPRDGDPYLLPAARGGGIPRDLRRPSDREAASGREDAAHEVGLDIAVGVESVVVEVPNRALAETHVIVDTPGMDSLSGLDETSLAALAEADALLYVMRHPSEGDRSALDWLRANAQGAGLSAVNTLAVLTGVDTLGSGDAADPWPVARRVARRNAGALRGLVSGVVPVVGLLAEAALADTFTEEDTQLIVSLARADRQALEEALFDADSFRRWDAGVVDEAGRARLHRLLGRYGIRVALDVVDSAAPGLPSTRALLDGLGEASGIRELRNHVQEHFVRGADRLRAASALGKLKTLCAQERGRGEVEPSVIGALEIALDALGRRPAVSQLLLRPALADLGTGRLSLPDEAERDLLALATGNTDPQRLRLAAQATASEVVKAADAATATWRRRAALLPRRQARHAYTAAEVCQAVADSAS